MGIFTQEFAARGSSDLSCKLRRWTGQPASKPKLDYLGVSPRYCCTWQQCIKRTGQPLLSGVQRVLKWVSSSDLAQTTSAPTDGTRPSVSTQDARLTSPGRGPAGSRLRVPKAIDIPVHGVSAVAGQPTVWGVCSTSPLGYRSRRDGRLPLWCPDCPR